MPTTNPVPVRGLVWADGSALFLARVVGWDNAILQPGDVEEIRYTISLVDQSDRHATTPVDGHEDVDLDPTEVLLSALVTTDDRWTVDDTGYNFIHLVDIATDAAFAEAGRRYVVTYWVTPIDSQPIAVVFHVDTLIS